MWGGEIFVDGKIVAEKRRRGRPPVHPRPPLVVAEVPDVARRASSGPRDDMSRPVHDVTPS